MLGKWETSVALSRSWETSLQLKPPWIFPLHGDC